jgi:protein phosphatase PTC7
LCVADGVGGWAESGVDPAIYSKKLCKIIDNLFEKNHDLYTI